MKYVRTIIAVPAVAAGVVLVGATQASAREIDPEMGYHEQVVIVPQPGPAVPVDDTANELRQAGAAAIGGSIITLAAQWVHRRRNPVESS